MNAFKVTLLWVNELEAENSYSTGSTKQLNTSDVNTLSLTTSRSNLNEFDQHRHNAPDFSSR